MKDINLGGQQFVLNHEGILFWPEENIAVASDLHLEKGSHFALHGQLIPVHDSVETLRVLLSALEIFGMEKLILLGDTFHDQQGYDRMNNKARNLFKKLCESHEVIWIKGNHDGAFVPPHVGDFEEFKVRNMTFRHEATKDDHHEISGHYHPKANIKYKGARISRSCFIEDGTRMIMPAFGKFTGGFDIREDAIAQFFPKDFTAHLLGKDSIYSIPSSKI